MMQQMLLSLPRPAPLALPDSVSNVGNVASLFFNPDGTISGSLGTVTPNQNWYAPTTAAIGNGYWVRWDFNSGSDDGLTIQGTWFQINVIRALTYANNGNFAQYRVRLATDAAGTNVVADKFVYFEAYP